MDGSLGSYVTASTGLSVWFGLDTFLKAILRGIFFALSKAESTVIRLYPLSINSCFSSINLLSLFSVFVQIRTILRAKKNGMFLVV